MHDDTDNCSPTELSDLGGLSRADFESDEEYRRWAAAILALYSKVADEQIKEAERLIERGLAFRQQAMQILDRANAVSAELARFLDAKVVDDDWA